MLKPSEIQLVDQTGDADCGAACLAMVTGFSVDEVVFNMQQNDIELPYDIPQVARYLVRQDIYLEQVAGVMNANLLDESVYLGICSSSGQIGYHIVVATVIDGEVTFFDPARGELKECNVINFYHLTDCAFG